MKPARRTPPLLAVLALLLPAARAAGETGGHGPARPLPPDAAPNSSAPQTPDAPANKDDQEHVEYAGVMRIGERKLAARDNAAALIAFREALRLAKGDDEAAPALLNLARAHRLSGDGVKAVATYEKLLRDHPGWKDTPLALLELGRTLREIGAPKLAIARFYSVIQSTLRLPSDQSDFYRRLVLTAQFEIAETHLAAGDTEEAVRFFRRLDTLDLAPEDRARARFRAAQAQILGGDRTGAVTGLMRYLALENGATDAAEARFLLARLHAEAGRREEALGVALELLRTTREGADAAGWREWQRRAGDFLADKFNSEGDVYSALLLYQALADLDAAPEWRAPKLYQVALCLEKLRQEDKARAAYAEIVKLVGASPPPAQAELLRMAKWRADQLDWAAKTEESVRGLSTRDDNAGPEPSAQS